MANQVDTPGSADQALRDALVRAGWIEAVMLERLGPDRSRLILADRIGAHVAQARTSLKPLNPWPSQPQRVTRILNNSGNQVRIRRTLDYVMPGDRLLEIGVGFGQVSGILLRDAGITGYTGIDISQERLDAVHEMAGLNGLEDKEIETANIDLMDITPEWAAQRQIHLILLEEVLEHVADAEAALANLARCMGPDACVLFTVPLLGRIEACWGHQTLFDVPRVQRMIAAAGLVTQHVEVIHDAWLFVLASPSEAVASRVIRLAALPRPEPALPAHSISAFVRVALEKVRPRAGDQSARTIDVRTDKDGAHVQVIGRRRKSPQIGGVTFEIAGDVALRLELAFPRARHIERFHVDVRDGRRLVASWTWDPSDEGFPEKLRTFVLRPGEPYGPFRPDGEVQSGRADAADVYVQVSGGGTAEFTVRRAAAVRKKLLS